MSVLIEGFCVVVRREAIARRYKGGWPQFVADVFTPMSCADRDIAAVGFMHSDDVRACVRRLQREGFVPFDAADTALDIAILDQRSGSTVPCAWLEFFREEVPGGTVAAARLAGSHETWLVCPDGWDFEDSLSKSFRVHDPTDFNETHELIGYKDGSLIFRDRRTGKVTTVSRFTALQHGQEEPSHADREALQQEYKALWVEARDLLNPYWGPENSPRMPEECADVVRARDVLERLIAMPDVEFTAWFLLGQARRLLRDHSGAYAAFACAYGLAPDRIETGRNLAQECIALGYAQEAITVSAATLKLAPDNAGLIANHAYALFVGGDLDGAYREVQRAEHLDPGDEITLRLRNRIEDARAGRVEASASIDA